MQNLIGIRKLAKRKCIECGLCFKTFIHFRERDPPSFHPLAYSPNAWHNEYVPGLSQETETPSGASTWLSGMQVHEPSSSVSQEAHKQEAGLKVETQAQTRYSM